MQTDSLLATLDRDLCFTYVTDTRLKAYSIEYNILGAHLYEVLPSTKQFEQHLIDVLTGEERAIDIELFINPNGERVYFSHTFTPIIQDNQIIGAQLTTNNITLTVESEIQNSNLIKEIQSCEANYFASYIFDYTHDGILITDANNDIRSCISK